jgi:dihydroflavonol-4-reductase
MKTLIVGGSGLSGGHTALLLQALGHEVTLMSRNAPVSPRLKSMAHWQADYVEDDVPAGRLEGFDSLVFCAAADVRNLPQDGSVTEQAFYQRYNSAAVPAFFESARAAGVARCAYLGTFYPQVAPERIDVCPYVRSRHEADVAIRAMSSDAFNVCSVNAPFILGHLSGLPIPHLGALVQYARGEIEGLPVFAPRGGTNHMTVQSVAEALVGALERGESAKAYLVGDENYSWKAYLERWFAAAGNPVDLAVSDEDHPMLPNAILFAGVGATVSYEPDAGEQELLGYGRNRVSAMIEEVVAAFSAPQG